MMNGVTINIHLLKVSMQASPLSSATGADIRNPPLQAARGGMATGCGSAVTEPYVSILTASYNHAAFIGETIESVLRQSFQDWELIIVDDGSVDGSPEIIAGYARQDGRIRLLRHPDLANHGLPATIQAGFKTARGKYIAFLESDDCWEPGCLAARKTLLEDSGTAVVVNNIEPVPMPGVSKGEREARACGLFKDKNSASRIQRFNAILLTHNVIPTFSCVMLRADLLQSCNFSSPVPRWLDWWLWLQVSAKSAFALLPDPLTRWRIHQNSYNYRTPLSAYLRDLRHMWRGIRKMRQAARSQDSFAEKLLLSCPFFVPAGLSLIALFREKGARRALLRIRGKFAKKAHPH